MQDGQDTEDPASGQQQDFEHLSRLNRRRGIAKRKFTSKVKVFDDCVLKDQPYEVVEGVYREVCDLFKRVEDLNEELLQLCGNDTKLVEDNLDYLCNLEQIKHKSHTTLIVIKNKHEKSTPEMDSGVNKIVIKKVEPPVFHGDVRDFPSFVKDFNRLVISYHGRDPFILRQCLRGKALEAVGRLDEFDQIWARLYERFGSSAKVIDAVLGEIMGLKPATDNSRKKLLDIINVVEQAWLDLKKIGKTNEISNSNCLGKIERLLPVSLQRDWTHKSMRVADENKFEEMVKFLVVERKVIEYMEDESRMNFSKLSVNHAKSEDLQNESSFMSEVVDKLTQRQEASQKQLIESINNLSDVVVNFVTQTNHHQRLDTQLPQVKPGFDSKPENHGLASGKCWLHGASSHDISNCKTFLSMDASSKFNNLKRMGACYICLEPSHISKNCPKKTMCSVKKSDNTICGKFHHPALHDIFAKSMMMLNASSNLVRREGVLLMMNMINSERHTLAALFDPGSNLTMIRHSTARKLGLKGSEINLSLTKVGNQTEQITSEVYKVPLTDNSGKKWIIDAVGFDDITSEVQQIDLSHISSILGVHPWQIQRPIGKIDLLIGSDYCILLPRVIKTVDNLQLLESPFGYCVRGYSGQISDCLQVRVNHMSCDKIDSFVIKHKMDLPKVVQNFFMTEELGVSCQPACGGCRCGKCSNSGHMTLKEERELKLINDGLMYDETQNSWVADYPWIKDPKELPNNYSMALARLMSTEKRLIKLGEEYSHKYAHQLEDMIIRGVARKLNEEEILSYDGPVFYLPHHEVHKPESKSTPLRLVFNSSASYLGVCLNGCLAKGPDCLNNILGVLLRFRERYVGLIGDIKKMYNSVKISELDQNCHRFLWRDMQQNRKPDQYVLTTVTFGDRPGGAIAMVALRKTAQMDNNYPLARTLIENNSYVDDLLTSIDSYTEARDIIKQIDILLEKGGFQIKEWIVSGDQLSVNSHPKVLDSENEKVLGLSWNPKVDFFHFKVNLNFSKRVRKLAIEPNISKDEVDTKIPQALTRRMILRQTAGIYDPLGFITPFTLRTKWLMRELILEGTNEGKRISWDDEINGKQYDQWKCIFKEMYDLEELKFERCLKPCNAVGNPDLIVFSDGSSKAYGAVAYARWRLLEGKYRSNLIASKCKLSPIRQITIPRLELCGAVLACRLRNFIEQEMDYTFASVVHIVDSEIVRSQVQKESFRFNTFVANRIAEIQSKSKPDEWYWIRSELNIADLTTRGCKPGQLHSSSCWQRGPDFLDLSMSEWPVMQGNTENLPDVLFVREKEVLCVVQEQEEAVINLKKFNSYERLINVTARILNVVQYKSLLKLCCEPEAEELQRAEMYWIRIVQKSIGDDWNTRYLRLGPVLDENGIITVGARISKWLRSTWNRNEYILLPPRHPFTKLLIQHIHERDHAGVETTLVKLQARFWVPGARRIIKTVKGNCVMCRRIDKVCETQCMGELPDERLNPSPPFYNTSLDLFGPFWVKDMVKKRTRMKVYGVIFSCMVCRAVHLDITEGYNTDSFLRVFRRFISIRGFPHVVYSDRGSQLVKANKELVEAVEGFDFKEVTKFGQKEGMTWKFTKSANAPWQNGCTEALIRLVKRAIVMSIGNRVLSFSELQTAMFEISNLINERPIGLKPGTDISLGSYLCPNDLLLGRASSKVPCGLFDNNGNLQKSFVYVNEIVESFWRKWVRDFFPTLIIRSKWHVAKRNVQLGDVVLVKDNNALRGEWRLAQVVHANPGIDGKVRNVTLRYKLIRPGSKYKGQRDILVDRSVHSIVVILPVEDQ